MKIAHILGSLGMGGAERVALDLAFEQKKLGHDVIVISLAPEAGGALASAFEEAKIEVLHIPKGAGLDWRLPLKISKKLRELHVDVAHTHNTQPLVYAAAAARLSRLVVIHTKHGQGHLVSKAGQMLRRTGAPFVHHFVAVSEATAAHARQQWAYPLPSRIQVITNGIRMDKHKPDASARNKIRKELGIAEDACVVGSIGRVDENKNHRLLVEAMEPLLGRTCHLVIAGDGPSMGLLQKLVLKSEHASSIHILGRRNDAHQIMAALDMFALPSLSEGLPLVLLEAMATSLPVVSTAVGGIPKVIEEGKTGFLVPPSDMEAMRKRLSMLNQNPDKAKVIGRAARSEVVETYSATRMAADYLALYLLASSER